MQMLERRLEILQNDIRQALVERYLALDVGTPRGTGHQHCTILIDFHRRLVVLQGTMRLTKVEEANATVKHDLVES